MGDANIKLKEAHFFIELLEALEKRGDSLTNVAPPIEEASFLLSAILNSFYSTIELLKDIVGKEQIAKFKSSFPIFYNRADKDGDQPGLRNLTVHVRHVEVDHEGYKPPIGRVNLNLRQEPKLIQRKTGVNLNLAPYFYLMVDNDLKRMTELCYEHYYELCKFVKNTIG